MSYNTRRTPTGRGIPPPQVSYHQQPASRPPVNVPPRNPSHMTQQPTPQTTGYSTPKQSGYVTTSAPPPAVQFKQSQQPPLPPTTAPAIQQRAPASQPLAPPSQQRAPASQPTAPPSQQRAPAGQPTAPVSQPMTPSSQPTAPPSEQRAPPSQPTAPPQTPPVKQEPPTPQDTPQIDSGENGDKEPTLKRPFWLTKKRPTLKLTNKEKKARQNAKLRRLLNPKSAMTLLTELKPGAVKINATEEKDWGCVASIDIDGKTFTGHAMNMARAKVLATESAVKHLLMDMMTKTREDALSNAKEDVEELKEEPTQEQEDEEEPKAKRRRMKLAEDGIPWGSVAAFALHKLFNGWLSQGMELPPVPEVKYLEEPVAEGTFVTHRPGPARPDFRCPPWRMPPARVFGRGQRYVPYPPRGPAPSNYRGPLPRQLPPPVAAAFLSSRSSFSASESSSPHSKPPGKKMPVDPTKMHPVMLLNQLRPNLKYQETTEGTLPNAYFKVTVNIDGQEYVGIGKNKKDAKKNAAKEVLVPMGIIYDRSLY